MREKNLKHMYRNREIYSTHKGEAYNAYSLVKKKYQVFKETEILSLFALCSCDKHHNLKQLREERV